MILRVTCFNSSGNDVIHLLTKNKPQRLRVELQTFSGEKGYAEYSTFAVGNETSKYKLNVSGFTGNIGEFFRTYLFTFICLSLMHHLYIYCVLTS